MSSRRNFLKQIGMLSGAVLIADNLLADPYKPIVTSGIKRNLLRVKGVIKDNSSPIKNVVVSDGVSVTSTNADGSYELITESAQDYIFVSLPSGYNIPQNQSGTANFYKPILKNYKDEVNINFDLSKTDGDTEHKFLLLADPQTLDMQDISRFNNETINDINELLKSDSVFHQNVFGVSCGDIMYDNLELFPEYEKAIRKTNLPFFQVLGNHDVEKLSLTDETSHQTFQKYFGPRYYSFNKGEIHYVVLDDIFWFGKYIGYLDQRQINWLKEDLSFVEKGKTVVVFCHIPPYNYNFKRNEEGSPANSVIVVNRELLYKTLEGYNSYIITGHMHYSEFLTNGGSNIHVCGAACGAWWTDNICTDGTPNGYMIYNAKGSSLEWIYKSTGKNLNHQMRSEIIKNHSGGFEAITNVWGFNDNDKLFWYENGIKKGSLERFLGYDPLAEKLFRGTDKPFKHTWVDPIKTDHLFRINDINPNVEIVLEYLNRFGNTYSEKLLI